MLLVYDNKGKNLKHCDLQHIFANTLANAWQVCYQPRERRTVIGEKLGPVLVYGVFHEGLKIAR
jgi:hypothetical protein